MSEPFQKKEKEFFIIENWNQINSRLIAGFTTKLGGQSEEQFASLNFGFHVGDDQKSVQSNRKLLSKKLGFSLDHWIGAEQTHDTYIAKVDHADAGKGALEYSSSIQRTDGLYTGEEDILLTLCFADCVPLFFYASNHHIIGIAHAGWKGTVNGIAKEMVDKWNLEGINPEEINVVIGPSICKNCYIVDDRVIEQVNTWVEDDCPYQEISDGQYHLDLKKLNQMILLKAGVKLENIELTNYCTSCDHQEFFSHRRDHGKTGRMLSFIGLKGDN